MDAAFQVHQTLGPGLLESSYEACLAHEFSLRELSFELQKNLPIQYKGLNLSAGYRLDFLVENQVIIELKSVDILQPVHHAQLLTYLKLSHLTLSYLINLMSLSSKTDFAESFSTTLLRVLKNFAS